MLIGFENQKYRHDITEILLKVALNITIKPTILVVTAKSFYHVQNMQMR
jgi:hypothetical protein